MDNSSSLSKSRLNQRRIKKLQKQINDNYDRIHFIEKKNNELNFKLIREYEIQNEIQKEKQDE